MQITMGTTDAMEAYRDPQENNTLRFRSLPGEQVVEFLVPDDWDLQDQFAGCVRAVGRNMAREATPAWIECPSDELLAMLRRHYGSDVGSRPEGWGDTTHPFALGTAMTTMIMLFLLPILFLATRLQLRTSAGRDWQVRVMADPASTGTGIYASGRWMGVTSDGTAPDIDSTTLPGEITVGTLARKSCAYSHVVGTAAYSLTAVFTYDQTVTLRKFGIFNAATDGTLIFETLLNTEAVGRPGDQTTITETVTV